MIDEVHTTAKVNGPLYKGVLWAGLAIGTCFVAFRLWVRLQTLYKLFSDDYLVILAILCFLLTAILQQTQLGHIYELYAAEAGKIIPGISWMQGQEQLLHHLIGFNTLFYTGIWSIKLSFIFFFRRLEGGVTNQRYWWWAVLFISIASYIASMADMQWDCLVYSVVKDFARYEQCGTPSKVSFQQTTFQVNCGLDVGTDILILSVPIALLWNVRISPRRKIVLIGLFSMTVLIMAISIIRVAVVSTKDVPSDITWLYFWSNIELIIALVVSSLGSFRQLYVSSQPEHTGPGRTTIFGSGSRPSKQGIFPNGKHYKLGSSKWSGNTRTAGQSGDRSNSIELINVPREIVN